MVLTSWYITTSRQYQGVTKPKRVKQNASVIAGIATNARAKTNRRSLTNCTELKKGYSMKTYKGSCVDNPFKTVELLEEVIDNSIEITYKTFKKHCLDDGELHKSVTEFPNDFTFHRYKSKHSLFTIYFYTWSAIEHFYW
jgi:hypothetical protein